MEHNRQYRKPQGYGNRRPRPNFQQKPRRNPLPEGFSLYYMAIECPPAINEKVSSFKQWMEQQYGCRAAAKSPAHITVVPPFRAEDEMTASLKDFVDTFNMGMVPLEIGLSGYGQFADRVLFIDIAPNPELAVLEKEAMAEFAAQFPGIIFGMKPEFNPHVTIATRDIPAGKLEEARKYFEQNHPYTASFEATGLSLYRLENGWWKKVD